MKPVHERRPPNPAVRLSPGAQEGAFATWCWRCLQPGLQRRGVAGRSHGGMSGTGEEVARLVVEH